MFEDHDICEAMSGCSAVLDPSWLISASLVDQKLKVLKYYPTLLTIQANVRDYYRLSSDIAMVIVHLYTSCINMTTSLLPSAFRRLMHRPSTYGS